MRAVPRLSGNALGSLYMTIGSLGYVVNDALVRAATERGLDVYQALCLRAMSMSVLFAAVCQLRGQQLRRDQLQKPLVVRVAAELGATALFFAALVRMEFANAQTILLLVPFAVTLAAALVLGERVSGRRYATVLAGFGGVLLVVQPASDGFSIWSLAVIAAAACLVVREFATRQVTGEIPAAAIALLTAVGVAVLTGVLSIVAGWGTITAGAAGLLVLAALCLTIGYVFTIQTVRVGDLSVSAPFRYTTMLGAVVLGYLVFDETPNGLTLLGCGVVLASGLYAIHLERQETAVPVLGP